MLRAAVFWGPAAFVSSLLQTKLLDNGWRLAAGQRCDSAVAVEIVVPHWQGRCLVYAV